MPLIHRTVVVSIHGPKNPLPQTVAVGRKDCSCRSRALHVGHVCQGWAARNVLRIDELMLKRQRTCRCERSMLRLLDAQPDGRTEDSDFSTKISFGTERCWPCLGKIKISWRYRQIHRRPCDSLINRIGSETTTLNGFIRRRWPLAFLLCHRIQQGHASSPDSWRASAHAKSLADRLVTSSSSIAFPWKIRPTRVLENRPTPSATLRTRESGVAIRGTVCDASGDRCHYLIARGLCELVEGLRLMSGKTVMMMCMVSTDASVAVCCMLLCDEQDV